MTRQSRTLPNDRSFVYLASQSPRRALLLDQLGVAHRPLLAAAGVDVESLEAHRRGETPTDYVVRVTLAKLQAADRRRRERGLPGAAILCADTTVAIGRTVLGKPANHDEACSMLQRLSGRTHRVCTAVAVAAAHVDGQTTVHQALCVSHVDVKPLDAEAIERYVSTGEPFGKAGGYAIQGRFAAHVIRIHGSHSGIMGLPLHETAQLLRRCEVVF